MAQAKAERRRSTDQLVNAAAWRLHASQAAPVIGPLIGVTGTAEAVEARLSDPAFIARSIREAPGVALAVLEIVVEHFGRIARSALVEIAMDRLGLTNTEVGASLAALDEGGLAFSFQGRDRWGGEIWDIALFDVSAEIIAEHVRGLTLPEPPQGTAATALPDTALPDTARRDLVALLASVAHLPVRYTQAKRVNMTSCKKLASVVGQNESALAEVIDRGIAEGFLGASGALLVPRLEALRALATGARVWAPAGDAGVLHQWAPAERWISREALVRAVSAKLVVEHMLHGIGPGHARVLRKRVENALEHAALVSVEREGHVFVRRAGGARATGTGDGHVTPSFEVMLGPDCDPAIALVVALAAEPVRFDRVITRKITPGSISAALAVGLDAQEILDVLGRVGRHGVPDNVRAMIADWARGARTVRVRKVWALEASTPDAADQAARALGASVVGRPSPTVVLVDGELASPEAALAKTAVKVVGAAAPLVERRIRPHDDATPGPSWIGDITAAPELRARAHDRAGLPQRVCSPDAALDAIAEAQSDRQLAVFFGVLSALWSAALSEYVTWARKLPEDAQKAAFRRADESPADFLFWLVRTPKVRRRMLGRAKRVEDLCVSEPLTNVADTTGPGLDVLRMLRTPAVARALASVSTVAPPAGAPAKRAHAAKSAPAGKSDGPVKPSDLEPQPRDEIVEALESAIDVGTQLWVRVSSKSQGERVLALQPEQLLRRGNELTLLATDVETGEGRSFPLANVVAVKPR